MDTSESIIQTIIKLGNEAAGSQEVGDYYNVDILGGSIERLIKNLINDHGYKDEKAVWEKISEIREKEWEKEMQQQLESEKWLEEDNRRELEQEQREAEALRISIEKAKQNIEFLKQKQMKQPLKNRIKNKIKKWRGFRI